MACGCIEHAKGASDFPHRHARQTRPTEPCPLCAEKHLGTAATLAGEIGYETVNRQHIAIELHGALWHLANAHPVLAAKIGEMVRAIQGGGKATVEWDELLAAIDPLARAAAGVGESGYPPVRRQRIIGELVCASWHLALEHPEVAMKVRDVRHAIQFDLNPSPDWDGILAAIDPLARAAAKPVQAR